MLFLISCLDFTMIEQDKEYIQPNLEFFETPEPTDKADILLVMDTSCSMTNDWTLVESQLPGIAGNLELIQSDWNLGIITADPDFNPGIIDVTSGNSPSPLMDLSSVISELSHEPTLREEGVQAAIDKLQDPWIRSEADLEVVFISDEDDSSSVSATRWRDSFESLKQPPYETFSVAIVGTKWEDCTEVTGPTYASLTNSTISFCDAAWGGLANYPIARSEISQSVFELAEEPIEASIEVYLDTDRNNNWDYTPPKTIYFPELLPVGTVVTVSYYTNK